ncbi:MAG: alpha/beta hydrolase [SAR324 cluster bacterium]|nr:alpha/beta hydrolase [SAR324 cluster bacterium]
MTTPYTSEHVTLNGFKMHFLDWGNAEAPPLLMVHGLTRQAHAFDGTAERLRERYHCLVIDMRGRGESDWTPPETYNYTQYVADVLAFLETRGLKQLHYAGTSMGGHIGMYLAEKQPEMFLSFLINDIGPESAAAGGERIQKHVAGTPAVFDSVDDCVEREMERFHWLRSLPKAQLESVMQWHMRKNDDGTWRYHYDPEIIRGRITGPEQRQAAQQQMWRGFKNLACPILLVRGQETDLLEMSCVDAMQAAQPGMALVHVPGVGHAPSLNEYPAVQAIKKFYE